MRFIRLILAMLAALIGLVLVSPILLMALPFWAVAFLTRRVAHLLEPRAVPWQALVQFEPTIGWRNKANLNTYAPDFVGEPFHVMTDRDGWRSNNRNIAESDIVVFGDSFAFGHAIDHKAFFANLSSNIRVRSIGANGYNMVQELLWMERLSSELSGKLVVWFIFLGNDLYDNLQPNMTHYRSPFVRSVNGTGDWQIVTEHVSPSKWRHPPKALWLQKLAEICSPTFLSERALLACEHLICRGRDVCLRAGASLVVITIPDPAQLTRGGLEPVSTVGLNKLRPDPDMPDKKIQEICSDLEVGFIALKSHLTISDYKGNNEVHWNEKGHQKVAAILQELYRSYASKLAKASKPNPLPAVFREPSGHSLTKTQLPQETASSSGCSKIT